MIQEETSLKTILVIWKPKGKPASIIQVYVCVSRENENTPEMEQTYLSGDKREAVNLPFV